MPITQLQTAKRAGTKYEAGFEKVWLETVPLLDKLPKVTNGSLQVRWRRETLLPTVGTRRLYQAFSESIGGWDEHAFAIPIYGGYVEIDEQLLSEPGGAEEWSATANAYNEAFAYRLNNDAINGDQGTAPDAMNGLKVIISQLPARMTITPGAVIDLSTPTLRDTNAAELIRYMHLAMDRVRQGTGKMPSLIVMDDDTFLLVSDAMRRSGFLNSNQDQYQTEITRFRGAEIIRGGFQYAEALSQSSAVIGSNFDGNGNTSMLFLLGGDDYVHWIQKHGLKVTQANKNSDGSSTDDLIVLRKKVEWPIAIRVKHPYSAARLNSIKIV